MLYAISYDMNNDLRRNHVAKALKDYGQRVQLSVFEVYLEGDELGKMITRLTGLMDEETDSIRIYPLCAACKKEIHVIGHGDVTQLPDVIII